MKIHYICCYGPDDTGELCSVDGLALVHACHLWRNMLHVLLNGKWSTLTLNVVVVIGVGCLEDEDAANQYYHAREEIS
jgi:hypothetical protein